MVNIKDRAEDSPAELDLSDADIGGAKAREVMRGHLGNFQSEHFGSDDPTKAFADATKSVDYMQHASSKYRRRIKQKIQGWFLEIVHSRRGGD